MRRIKKIKKYIAVVMTVVLTILQSGTIHAADALVSPLKKTVSSDTADYSVSGNNLLKENALKLFGELLKEREIQGLVFHDDAVMYKELTGVSETKSVASGSRIYLMRPVITGDGVLFYEIKLKGETGYIDRGHIACEDERLLSWEEKYVPEGTDISYTEPVVGGEDSTFIKQILMNSGADDFPEDYKTLLAELSKTYPGWQFVKVDTNVKWSDAVAAQLQGDRSLIEGTAEAGYVDKNNAKGSGWYLATKEGVEHYMDPRNYLDEKHIFAFETMTYNASYQTEAVVSQLLKGTFMSGNIEGTGQTYANAFCQIGADSSVMTNPLFLAARVKQEQSASSKMISGTYSGYEGYYNYFNIQAIGTGETAIQNGLKYASSGSDYGRPWNTRFKSLKGGAEYVASQYIKRGQDTLYFQKYNMVSAPYYNHQYMQNIRAPYFEGATTGNGYSQAGVMGSSFVFKIPVFSEMPNSEENEENRDLYASDLDGTIQDKVCTVSIYNQKAELVNEVTTLSGTTANQIPGIFTYVSPMDGQVLAGYFSDRSGKGLRIFDETEIESDISVYPVLKSLSASVTVLPIGGYLYTGKAIRPKVSVYDGKQLLIRGVDYSVTYKNNKNVPSGSKTPQVIIRGKGKYSGVRYESFSILPRSLETSKTMVKGSMLVYSGKQKQLMPVIYYNGKALRKNKDYTAVYEKGNYTDTGVYKVVLKGLLNYTGTVNSTQLVSDSVPITKCRLTAAKPVYNGKAQKIKLNISYKGEYLSENTHYRIIYPKDFTSAGVKLVFVKGIPEKGYFGTRAVKVNIKGGTLAGCKVNRISPVTFSVSGNNIPSIINVADKSGAVLKENRDYKLSYENNEGIGTASVRITGINGYTGNVVRKYKIVGIKPEKIKKALTKPIG